MDLEAVVKEAMASEVSEEVSLMKKKIQLSEGQRRAEYEEFDAEKKRLSRKVRTLKKEIRDLSASRPSRYVDEELLMKSGKPLKLLKPYLGKTPEEVEEILDLQCIDLTKKLDLLKYELAKKNERLASLKKELHQMETENTTETVTLFHPGSSNVTKLENKIHETKLQLHEMRHMEKKYTKMRQSLLDDRVFFQSTLDKYEEDIAKQAKEIDHLKNVRDEAVRLRDKTRRKLNRLEALLDAQEEQREQELKELKRRVEEGRANLERVERSLVPSSSKGLAHQESGEMAEDGLSTEQLAKEALLAKLLKLKEVTGAKDEEDILVKLKSQKETKERLLQLKASIEKEKQRVELKREQLEAELEAVKFSEVKEKERNEEEIEKLEKEIEEAEKNVSEYTALVEGEKIQLKEVQNYIFRLRDLLRALSGDEQVNTKKRQPSIQNASELLDEVTERFNNLLTTINEAGLNSQIEEPIEDLFVRELSKLEGTDGGKRQETEKEGEKLTDEAAGIPTRDFLKRQSQMIVEAQSKRKGAYPKENYPASYR